MYSRGSDPVPPAHLFSSSGTHSPAVHTQLGTMPVNWEQNERLHEKPGDARGHRDLCFLINHGNEVCASILIKRIILFPEEKTAQRGFGKWE